MFLSFVVSPFVQGKQKEYLDMIMIRMIQLEKEELEGKLGEVERERVEGEARLIEVREEVEAVLGQVEESSEKISRSG